jgi:hypothetical protein
MSGLLALALPPFRPDSALAFHGFVPVLSRPVEGVSRANFTRENGLHRRKVSSSLFNPQIRDPGSPGNAVA